MVLQQSCGRARLFFVDDGQCPGTKTVSQIGNNRGWWETIIIGVFAEGPGTGFLHKKRVPGGLLSAPTDPSAKDSSSLFWLRPEAAVCKKTLPKILPKEVHRVRS